MIHLVFLFHLVALFIGGAAILISILRFFHYRNSLILKFSAVLFGTELIMAGLAVTLYGNITRQNLFGLSRFLDSIGVLFLSIFMYLLIAPLFKFSSKKILKILHLFICFVIAILLIGFYRFNFPEIFARVGQLFFFSTIVLPLIGAIIKKKDFIGSAHFKRSLHLLFISLAAILPIVIIDALGFSVLPHDSSVGLLMIVLCLNAIRIAWSDLTNPIMNNYNEKLQKFCEEHKLSPREKDIVENVAEGLTNREIGEVLFISYKTVENHLSRIYQKADIDNRYQLIQEINK